MQSMLSTSRVRSTRWRSRLPLALAVVGLGLGLATGSAGAALGLVGVLGLVTFLVWVGERRRQPFVYHRPAYRRGWKRWHRRHSDRVAQAHSAFYAGYLQSPAWHARRRAALRRAHHRCQECGTHGRLEVHHLTYARLGRELPTDLRALCHTCHVQADRVRQRRQGLALPQPGQ